MFNKVGPWTLAALGLAALSLLLASWIDGRVPALVLAVLGLLVVGVGAVCMPAPRRLPNLGGLFLSGIVNAGILAAILIAPGVVNPRWGMDQPVVESDPNQLVIARWGPPLHEIPLGATDWADAATETLRQDDMFMRVKSVKIGRLPEKSETPVLLIHLIANQIRPGGTIPFVGFGKGKPQPVLVDESGRTYRFLGHRRQRPFSAAFDVVPLRVDEALIFALEPAALPKVPLLLEIPTAAWGRQGVGRFRIRTVNPETKLNFAEMIVQVTNIVRDPNGPPADRSLGRALFAKNCFECHTLFGVGSKVGPDLTPYKREDLKLLLTSIINPSAEIAKGYEPSVVTTTSGQVFVGIIKVDADPVMIQTSGKLVKVPREEIESKLPSKISIMPNELLKGMSLHEIRSLIAYLSGKQQVRPLAIPETVTASFFNGNDFFNWQPIPATWKIVSGALGGEIVAPNPHDGKPATLTSDLVVVDDFQFTLRIRPGANVRGAILIGDEEASGKRVARVEFTGGGAVVVRIGDGKVTPVGATANNAIGKDAWSKLEIVVKGQRLQVRLKGKEVVDITDPNFPARRLLTLEGSPVADLQLRFANLDLQVFPAKE